MYEDIPRKEKLIFWAMIIMSSLLILTDTIGLLIGTETDLFGLGLGIGSIFAAFHYYSYSELKFKKENKKVLK